MPEFLQTGRVRTAYDCTGNGPPVLLLHGAEASRHMFSALSPWLAPHWTVIAYDQRDCGDSQGPAQPADLADLADEAAALILGLGHERACVFGSSFGGRVAQALAARHPSRVEKLVLGSTWPLPHALQELHPEGAARTESLRKRLPESAEELAGLFFPEPFLAQRPELRRVFSHVQPANARSDRRQIAVNSSLMIDWSGLQMPVLLLAGELDQVVPPDLTLRIAERLTHAQQVLLSGVGHATALQAPELLADLLTRFFLAEHSAPSLNS